MRIIPIILSLLDLDRYKLTMSQFAFFKYRNVHVKYAFTNRTKTKKANAALLYLIPYIKEQIELVRTLRLTYYEMMHLKNQKNSAGEQLFKDEFLEYLSTASLPPVNLYEKNGELHVETEGEWAVAMLWETILLAIIAELYARFIAVEKHLADTGHSVLNEQYYKRTFLDTFEKACVNENILDIIMKPYHDNAMVLLEDKIESYLHHPSIAFFEFGTLRRFSAKLQEMVVARLNQAFHKPQFIGQSQFLGTSNEHIAMKLGIKAGGTMAHEMFMVMAGLKDKDDSAIVNSQYEFLREWNAFYGYDLSVALTDTFGSDYFFANCPKDIAEMYSFREDSATDLFAYTEAVIDVYRKYKINQWEKCIVHSNGLNKNKVITMDSYSQGKIKKVYGQGTDFTCDVGFDFPHLSMVIKAVEADGVPLVKLSDNLAKAIGQPEQVERYKRIFQYVNEKSEVQVY